MPRNTWTRWTGQKTASWSQADGESDTEIQMFILMWSHVTLQACEAQCIKFQSCKFQKKARLQGKRYTCYLSLFQALISMGEGRSLKTTFFILPCPLASACFPNGRLRKGNWTPRRKKGTIFPHHPAVPSAVSIAADGSISTRCDGSSASSRSMAEVGLMKLSDLRLTSPSSCPSRKLALWPIPCLKYIQQFSIFPTGHWQIQKQKETSQSYFPLNRDIQSRGLLHIKESWL